MLSNEQLYYSGGSYMVKRLAALILIGFCAVTGVMAAEIHTASAKGDLVKVKALVDAKPALINAKDTDAATPPHHAVAKGHIEVVKFLISKNVNASAAKNDGVTPLHVAAAFGEKDIAEILIKAKADVNAKDKKGRTPAAIAQEKGYSALAALLSPSVVSPAPLVSNATDTTSIALEFIGQVSGGQYEKAVEKFDSAMKNFMPAPQLKTTWETVISQAGPFVKVTGTRREVKQGIELVFVTCQFQQVTADAQIAFNSSKQISGIYIVPPKP